MQQWVRFSAKVAAGFLSAWFLLLPVTAYALGLGNIKMESALNQPLKAKIQLLSANADDINGLQVKLASRQAFLRAGVDRTQLLSNIKFNIVKKDGKYYVILTTNQPIREPFLNFLVELNYKNGRMLREYTVLLDPARNAGEQQAAQQAPETTPPASPAPTAPAPSTSKAPAPTSPFMTGSEDEPSNPMPGPSPTESNKTQAPQPESPLLPKSEPAAPKPQMQTAKAAPAAPVPEPAPMPTKATAPAKTTPAKTASKPKQPFATSSSDNGELFPAIPLTAYKETGPTGPSGSSQTASAPQPAVQPAGELDYGITKKGDNLWEIAKKLKPNNQVTIYQVMMALQKSNPKAFVHGNIHRLKVGQVMRIADPSMLSAMSKAQARKQYQLQTRQWENYLARTRSNVPRQVINAGEQNQAPSSNGAPSGELTLSTPSSKSSGAGTGSSNAESNSTDAALLEQQARKAMQEAKTQRKKNAELMAKLDDLNAELKRMQNLVNVKNSDLAELQHKLDELNKQRAASASSSATTPNTQTAQTKPQPETSSTPATPPAAATPPKPATPAETTTAKPETPAEPQAGQASSEPQKPAKPVAPPPPPSSMPTPPAKSSGGGIMGMIKGFFGGVMGGLNAMMLIIGGVIILVLLLLVFIIVRRRKSGNFQESILTGGGAGDSDPMTMDTNASQESSLMGSESSFLSDFAISGVSAIQAEDSEVDPLTEADVFMAYGRYEAAEERLQEAINQDPDRGELRVKLLELYNTTKDGKAFETSAEDFYASLGGNADSNPLWQKVIAMGRELVPNNPLFSGGVAAPAASAPAAASSADLGDQQDVMDIGLDTGVFNTSDFNTDSFNEPSGDATPAASESDAGESGGLLDFNLDMDEGASNAPAEPAASSEPDDAGLDFSLDMDSNAGTADAGQDMDFNLDLPDSSEEQDGGLDFNLGSSDTTTETEEPDGTLDFNLDSSDTTAETEAPATEDNMDFNLDLDNDNEPTATDIKLGMDDEDASMAGLDFDFSDSTPDSVDTGETGGDSGSGTDMNLDASDASMDLDMSGGDEVGTKLDLARAYIDMGDPDGARSILDEVLEEGNDGQKQEAQQLMTQIG